MHDNPHGSRVPCHRVIQKGGSLSPNYCLTDPHRQRRLLEREGVTFQLDGRVDMDRHEWRPGERAEPQRRSGEEAPEHRN